MGREVMEEMMGVSILKIVKGVCSADRKISPVFGTLWMPEEVGGQGRVRRRERKEGRRRSEEQQCEGSGSGVEPGAGIFSQLRIFPDHGAENKPLVCAYGYQVVTLSLSSALDR